MNKNQVSPRRYKIIIIKHAFSIKISQQPTERRRRNNKIIKIEEKLNNKNNKKKKNELKKFNL